MKKILCVSVALAMLVAVVGVKADTIISYTGDTTSTWYVKTVAGYDDSYVASVNGDWFTVENKASVVDPSFVNDGGGDSGWGKTIDCTDVMWISASDSGLVPNGYYSYGTTISGNLLENSVNWLALELFSDDQLRAIYINGIKVQGIFGVDSDQNWIETITYKVGLNTKNWDKDGDNIIEFIIYNDDRDGGGPEGNRTNLSGMAVMISGSEDNPFSHTPEPATLLILGFGAVGAGFAARRRMKG